MGRFIKKSYRKPKLGRRGYHAMTEPMMIDGRFLLREKLATGGAATVYLATDQRTGRDVAVKVLPSFAAQDLSARRHLEDEGRLLASIHHPALVDVYAFSSADSETSPAYIAMEFVRGETLDVLLHRKGSIDPRSAMRLGAEIGAALEVVHRHGLVHRDLKPANVMVIPSGSIKLLDFGLAWRLSDRSAMNVAAMTGTVNYMSPEQAAGGSVDPRSDIYSLGAVLYELVTGRPPFMAESLVEVIAKLMTATPAAPSTVVPAIPPELDEVILTALSREPSGRYGSAGDMRRALQQATSRLVSSRSTEGPEARPSHRHPSLGLRKFLDYLIESTGAIFSAIPPRRRSAHATFDGRLMAALARINSTVGSSPELGWRKS